MPRRAVGSTVAIALCAVVLMVAGCGKDVPGKTGPTRLVDAPRIDLKNFALRVTTSQLRVVTTPSVAPRTDVDHWWSVASKSPRSRELVISWLDRASSGDCAADVASVTETDTYVAIAITSSPGRLPHGVACAAVGIQVKTTIKLSAPLGKRHVKEVVRCHDSC